MPHIKIENYDHINRSFKEWDTPQGKKIRNKREYDEAMKRDGLVSEEKAADMVRAKKEKRDNTPYKASPEMREFMDGVNSDKNGNVKLSGRQIDFMKDRGMTFDREKLERMKKDGLGR